MMHADRTNRSVLLLVAVLLVAAGAVGSLISFGKFGRAEQHTALLHNQVGTFFGRHGDWLWPVIAVAALLLMLLSLRWLVTLLFTTDRSGDLSFPTESAGLTRLSSSAVTEAVAGEIETYRGVSSVKARLIGDETDPELVITATLEDTADFAAVRTRIETDAVAHARGALDKPALLTEVNLRIASKRSTRVS